MASSSRGFLTPEVTDAIRCIRNEYTLFDSVITNHEVLIARYTGPENRDMLHVFAKARNDWMRAIALPPALRGQHTLNLLAFSAPNAFAVHTYANGGPNAVHVLIVAERYASVSVQKSITIEFSTLQLDVLPRDNGRFLLLEHSDKGLLSLYETDMRTVEPKGAFAYDGSYVQAQCDGERLYVLGNAGPSRRVTLLRMDSAGGAGATSEVLKDLEDEAIVDAYGACYRYRLHRHRILSLHEKDGCTVLMQFDIRTRRWTGHEEHPIVLAGYVHYWNVLSSGEVLYRINGMQSQQVFSVYLEPPRLCELCLRLLHQCMPKATQRHLRDSAVLNARDLEKLLRARQPPERSSSTLRIRVMQMLGEKYASSSDSD